MVAMERPISCSDYHPNPFVCLGNGPVVTCPRHVGNGVPYRYRKWKMRRWAARLLTQVITWTSPVAMDRSAIAIRVRRDYAVYVNENKTG
jgi:hypothetical protein